MVELAPMNGLEHPAEDVEGSAFPSYGPDWDRAIDYGIDVSLLLENLELAPTQRLERLQQVVRFHAILRNAPRRTK